MRRPLWFRALIAVWGFWCTAVISEAPGVHACAVHGNHAGVSAGDAHAGHGHAAHLAHAAHSSAHDDSSDRAPVGCTCLGDSCCSGLVAAPGRSSPLPGDIVVVRREQPFAEIIGVVVQRPHSLPFANGPPSA